MRFSLDTYLENILPWDLSITLGGESFPVRPLTVGDVAVMEALGAGDVKSLDKMIEFVESLFVDKKPDVRRMRFEQMLMVITGTMAYWAEMGKKNGPAVKAAVAAVATPPSTTSGN